MSLKVDLRTHMFNDDLRLYKLFPGKRYKFYELIRSERLAILDVRNLGDLGVDPATWADEAVLRHISDDRAQRRIEGGLDAEVDIDRTQGDKAVRSLLRSLFFEARRGDLVLVPGRGYDSDVLVGQLTEEPGNLRRIQAADRNGALNEYFGRKLNWIGSVEKRHLGRDLTKRLQSQVATFELRREYIDEVLKLALDSYVYDGQYVVKFKTQKDVFTPKDNFLTSVWLELIEVLDDAERNNLAFAPEKSIYDLVIASDIKEGDRDDLSIRVQSPGWFRVRSLVVSPLVSVALFAMASQGVAYQQAAQAEIVASAMGGAGNACLGQVDASVKAYLTLLGATRWEQVCQLVRQAERDAKLRTDARVSAPARNDEESGGR